MPFSNNFPYTDLHDINLNKFLKAIKNLLGGHGGEYLKKKSNIPFDYEWTNIEVASGVNSVNGQTGNVVLDASDVGALPDSYTPPPAPVQSVNGQTGAVVLDASDVGALPDSYTPPPAPVQSVNGQTGAVVLDADDVGALPDTYTAPVQSVNGQTGTVVLDADDVGALPDTTFTTGSSGTWSWKKWSDGTLEIDGFYSGPPVGGSHYTVVGTFYGYYVSGFSIPNDAQPIDNNYSLIADWSIGTGFTIPCGTVSTKTTTGFNLYALATSANQSTVKINIYIRAKWR